VGPKRGIYLFKNTVDIFHHIIVPKTDNQIPHRLQNLRSLKVGSYSDRVLSTVKLDDQLSVGTKEIDDKPVDWKLPSEFPAVEAAIT